MRGFQDHFSRTAERYAMFRPSYPRILFGWLAENAPRRSRAWDCGTGNGQAALGLSEFFQEVIATDPSRAQLLHARANERVQYAAMTAEHTALARASMQLVTVAQALHWFDMPQFYREVQRVVVPGGLIALWTYGLLGIEARIDEVVHDFHRNRVGEFWPPERAIVDAGLRGVPFPFERIDTPDFAMHAQWTLPQLAGYVSTWSAVNRYTAARGEDPVGALIAELAPLWGRAEEPRRVTWPVDLRVGIVRGS